MFWKKKKNKKVVYLIDPKEDITAFQAVHLIGIALYNPSNAEEIIKEIHRQCEWALDGYSVNDYNQIHSTLMKGVARRVAIKLGVAREK